jgi:DNA end-binding protein Ku
MAPRASWKGYLKLSLVSCPVRLYPATSASERISFNQLHKDTHNRINMKPVDPELGLVERSDLVKGYEYEDKQYIIIEDSDLESVRIESTHTMNIEAFVDESEVDVIYQDAPYYLSPDGAMAEETFVVLRDALRKSGKLAIARLVMTSRERVVTIGARENGMFVCTLRNPSEVRGTAEYFGTIPVGKPDPEMLELAEKLIEQKVTKFDPKAYEDRYEAALMQMIREKLKGHKPIIAAAPERGNVINLMDALKASLGQSKPPARSKSKLAEAPKPAAKPTKAAEAKAVPIKAAKPAKAEAPPAKPPVSAAKAAIELVKSTTKPARKKA